MAKIQRIVVHCTSDPANAVRSYAYFRRLFFDIYKWKHFGYHAIVFQDGSCQILQSLPKVYPWGGSIDDSTLANGARGYNSDSLHIAYVGGIDPVSRLAHDTRTLEQKDMLRIMIAKWKRQYKITEVVGHRDLPGVRKACPCFDARKEYENV